MQLEELEKNLGYTFKDKTLLQTALTHSSYANDCKIESNEKLEFLGDSILGFITGQYLYRNYHFLKEGEMSKVRATVVCEKSLYQIATKLRVKEIIKVGKGEIASRGNEKPAILADSIEAMIAGMYLDSGLEPAKKFILDNLKEPIEIASKHVGMKDYKTVLQEKLQEHKNVHIEYKIIHESGPDHDKSFTAQVECNGEILATGEGKTKKQAEMQAAKKALDGEE